MSSASTYPAPGGFSQEKPENLVQQQNTLVNHLGRASYCSVQLPDPLLKFRLGSSSGVFFPPAPAPSLQLAI